MPIAYTGPRMSYQDIGSYIGSAINVEKQLEEQRAEAIRWQGAQEYDTLVKSGVSPQDAFSRTATKLFYNEPRALGASINNIGTGEGEVFYNEAADRWFTKQPNGKIAAVSQAPPGWTTVRGPNGQTFKIPITGSELANAPRTSIPPQMPEVVSLPGGAGLGFLNPAGTVSQIRPQQTEIITVRDPTTGRESRFTRAEIALQDAQAAAKPLLDEYNDYKAKAAAGQMKYGPDLGWWPTTAYTNQMAGIESRLKDLGLDTKGDPLPGSKLAAQMAGPPAQEQLAPNEIVVDVRGRKIVYDRNTHQPLREIK